MLSESSHLGGLLTQSQFAVELAAEMERLSPGWSAVNHGGDVVELWAGQTPGASVPVGPAYNAYRAEPGSLSELIGDAARQATELFAAASTWEAAKAHLLPQLLSLGRYQALDESGALPVMAQMSDEVFLVFELRVEGMTVLVHQGLQVAWGRTTAEIFQQALANLERITPDLEQGADGVWRFPVDDGYEAVRALLLGRFASVEQLAPGSLVISIPSQERLYVFDAADAGLLERMRNRIDTEFRESERPLTPTWLTLQEGRLTLYRPSGGQG